VWDWCTTGLGVALMECFVEISTGKAVSLFMSLLSKRDKNEEVPPWTVFFIFFYILNNLQSGPYKPNPSDYAAYTVYTACVHF